MSGLKCTYLLLGMCLANVWEPLMATNRTCSPGYRISANGTCQDVVECDDPLTMNLRCGHNTDCHNTPGGFYCTCKRGYRALSGETNFTLKTYCKDIDECGDEESRVELCGLNAECVNVPGSFYCSCHIGYASLPAGSSPSGFNCTDIDECQDEACGPNALCHNTPGGFLCP
ncbi:adhesion G protein-coupled receptor E1-like [Callorhinchus milii]|uniref:adhesion G protein-coupled receptor E1-like n=1 Tax=Callorhinchus milii TaxID=7868 RepID=UPI0004575CA4|nr:adhesion G protein-coupled receptor E1-like [Callorhinchus milii]|eukprot:gi/632985163/ref/XP_007909524.1/ PREDICTED: EGF-like module-containing mucin-like hormone receptor-like 1 [Callorhinchus milii]